MALYGIGFAAVWPSMVTSAISYIIAKVMLDAQKDMRARMTHFANLNMDMADEMHGSYMSLRAYDQSVYNHVTGISCDGRCATQEDRGATTGYHVATKQLKATVFGHSRFNTGNRTAAIRDALAAGAISAGEGAGTAGNYEDMLVEACQQLRWTSVAAASGFSGGGIAGAFGGVAQSMINLEDQYRLQANGAVQAFGASLTHFAISAYEGSKQSYNGGFPVGESPRQVDGY